MKTLRTMKDVFLSSLPLVAIIIIVCCFISPMKDPMDYIKLAVGYFSVVVGQSLFLVGLDVSILPIGKLMGNSLVRLKKPLFIIFFGVIFGVLATVAEPALSVLAQQTNMIIPSVNKTLFIVIMGGGIGVFVGFSLYRIMKDINIKIVFAFLYILLFALIFFVPPEFIALSFDGSGATTGDVSVPFILALGIGVSHTMSKNKTNDDTFGIIGIASVGPIIALFLYGILLKITGAEFTLFPYTPEEANSIGQILLANISGVALVLFPIVLVFLPFQIFLIKLPKKELTKMLFGTLTVYLGLLIFLSGIDFGFAFAGKYIGEVFLDANKPEFFKWLLLIVGFILGASITLSEPAVTVLGEQLEDITHGHIKKITIRLTLAIGIGFASLFFMLKVLLAINILWFLIPLYTIALIMMIFTTKLFVGLAFDSGGVTGGALTSAFLTPLSLGVAQASGVSNILVDGFGIIAFISVTPIIAVQALGIMYGIKLKKLQNTMQEQKNKELESLNEFVDIKENNSLNFVYENAGELSNNEIIECINENINTGLKKDNNNDNSLVNIQNNNKNNSSDIKESMTKENLNTKTITINTSANNEDNITVANTSENKVNSNNELKNNTIINNASSKIEKNNINTNKDLVKQNTTTKTNQKTNITNKNTKKNTTKK